MKRATAILIILIGFSQYVGAQNFSEWFRQKKTQKKYLLEQIAALKVYGGYVRKGYDISKKGLNMIGDLKDGDFKLHEDYFSKLKSVNPEISKSPHVKDIITMQGQTRQLIDHSKQLSQNSSALNHKEVGYINTVYQRLNKDCLVTLSELEKVLHPGELEMKDDERMERIGQLYNESLGQYGFAKSFTNSITRLLYHKANEQKEINDLRTGYGIKND